MTITVTTKPTYALPAAAVACDVGASGTDVNYVRLWVTDAPPGSRYRALLDQSGADRVPIGVDVGFFTTGRADLQDAGDAGAFDPRKGVSLELDVGGAYTFVGQEYVRGASSYGGGYAGSPDSFVSETKVGSEQTLTVHAGTKLSSRVGVPEYGTAELVVWVWDDTIRPTTVAVHGEKTPAVVNARGRAETAALSSTVIAALAALENKTASAVVGNLDTLAGEMKTDLVTHMASAVFHSAADTTNDDEIRLLNAAPTTPAGHAQFISTVRNALDRHMRNLPTSITEVHKVSGNSTPDYANLLIAGAAPNAADPTQILIAYADTFRAYEAHRASTAVHASADGSNVLSTALGELVTLHKTFLEAMRAMSPTAPTTTNEAETTLVHSAGFRRVR